MTGNRKRSHEEGTASCSKAEPTTSKKYCSRFNRVQPTELFSKDLISAMKMKNNERLLPTDYFLIEDSWKPEWDKGVQVPVLPEALPKPEVRILRERSKEADFKLPEKLIRSTHDSFFNPEIHVVSNSNTLAEETCCYDMDQTDFQWLTSVNQDREDFGLQPLEETFVEQVVQEFELQAYANSQESIKSEEGLGAESDEDMDLEKDGVDLEKDGVDLEKAIICDVCRSPDSSEINGLVLCHTCNIYVHQYCYGITEIPEGGWICDTCALGIRPPCVLCPNRGGAMKPIGMEQEWVHVGCAVWMPESSFDCVEMERIIDISQVPANRWALFCTLCNGRKGACITCSDKGCKAAFHVTCAFNEGLQISDTELETFCQKHGKRKFSIFSDSEENISSSPDKNSLTSEERDNLEKQKIQEKEAEFYNCVNIDEVSAMFQCDRSDIETIFNYWKLNRKSDWNQQFLTPKIETESHCIQEDSPTSSLEKMAIPDKLLSGPSRNTINKVAHLAPTRSQAQ